MARRRNELRRHAKLADRASNLAAACHYLEILSAGSLIWRICSLNEGKRKRFWKPGPVEIRAGNAAQEQADREAARIPWPTLLKVRQDYIHWQAYLLWVRVIEEAEGKLPRRLVETVKKHTRGYICHGAEYRFLHQSGPPSGKLWPLLETWINEHVFRQPWQEGWINAVGYYAVRDLVALRDEAYWSYWERRWKRSKPAVYPSFREWRESCEHGNDEAVDEFEVADEIRKLMKMSRGVSSRTLRKTVDRYVGWQVFVHWARTVDESSSPLPVVVEREMRRRCPGFLETDAARRDCDSREPRHRVNRLMRWIEDREFALSKKQG